MEWRLRRDHALTQQGGYIVGRVVAKRSVVATALCRRVRCDLREAHSLAGCRDPRCSP
ncbi:MAG: hypothetical protein ACOYM3_20680 [Terrimicrobiaceae bacterium]